MVHKELPIEKALRDFHHAFPYLEIDPLIEYFAFFGGVEDRMDIDPFGGLEATIQREIIERYPQAREWIEPSYLHDDPYRSLLIAIARGDGKILNAFSRAGLSESVGGQMLQSLESLSILRIIASRESRPQRRKGQQLPREYRGYRIQPKVRFVQPFYRFWFGFVAPYASQLEQGDSRRFWENFHRHRDRALSLVFEQLSNALLVKRLSHTDPILSYGSWWDRRSEYDLLAITRSGRLILGECKYKGRAITRGELTKLQEKAAQTGIRVDTWALFSRNGFSKELERMAGDDLWLFGIEDFFQLVVRN